MNRMEEYELLRRRLSVPPDALEGCAGRVQARIQKRRRLRRRIQVPAGSIAAAFAAFVVLVNVSTPFAQACATLPLLKPLVEAVCFNPSLQTALEHNYAQDVLASQTAEEFTVTVDAMVVDEAEIAVFYHIDCAGDAYEKIYTDNDYLNENGQTLNAFLSFSAPLAPGEVGFDTISFPQDLPLPDAIRFTLSIRHADLPGGGRRTFQKDDYTVTFDLPIARAEVAPSKIYHVQKWVEIDGQKLFIDRVDVHPTHTRVYVRDDPANTAWLQILHCTLRDENGNTAGRYKNGLIATGSIEEGSAYPFSVHLESPYFWNSEHLTLEISGADWLDKETQYTTFDLSTGFAQTPLPPSVYSARAYWKNETLYIASVARRNGQATYVIASTAFHAQPGDTKITDYTAGGFLGSARDPLYVPEGYFGSSLTLPNYPYDDTVTVRWNHTHETALETPLTIPLA